MRLLRFISNFIDNDGFRFIKCRWGKKLIEQPRMANPFGVDSVPLKGEVAVIADTGNNSDTICVGFVSKNVLNDLAEGDSATYSKRPTGEVGAFVKHRSNGDLELNGKFDFAVRYLELEAAYNELNDKFNQLVTAFNSHVHVSAAPGNPTAVPTPSTNIPASQSTGDITRAKISKVNVSSYSDGETE